MGFMDIKLLAGVSGNQEAFRQVDERLRQYAASVGLGLFSDPVIRQDAVDGALDKVTDWLGGASPLHIDHPWSYAKRIVGHALIDSARTRKTREITLDQKLPTGEVEEGVFAGKKAHADGTAREELACIEEGFARLDDGEGEEDTARAGSGWRVFLIIDQSPTKRDLDEFYHPHKWLLGIDELLKFQWWWSLDEWHDWVAGLHKRQGETLKGSRLEAVLKLKEHNAKLWSKYNLLEALIQDIPGRTEAQVMRYFLWGFKPVDVARELNISEPYVSKVLRQKWLKTWGWEDSDVYQARLLFLTHFLVDQFRRYEDSLSANRNDIEKLDWQWEELELQRGDVIRQVVRNGVDRWEREVNRRVTDTLRDELVSRMSRDCEFPDGMSDLEDEWSDSVRIPFGSARFPRKCDILAQLEQQSEYENIDAKCRELRNQSRALEQLQTERRRSGAVALWQKVVSSPQTRTYFGDLEQGETKDLLGLCRDLGSRWYWPRKNGLPDWEWEKILW